MSTDDRLAQVRGTLFQAHPWHGIDPGDAAGPVQVFIEIVPTDVVKYELDKPSGHLRVDRPQRYSSLAPMPYGFIPRTYCGTRIGARCSERTGVPDVVGDGDPMDICLLTEKSFAQGNFVCRARAIGGLRMIDGGQADDKIVAVLVGDLVYGQLRELADAPAAFVERLRHYFLTYKQIPGGTAPRKVAIPETYDAAEAQHVIELSFADYRDEFGAPEGRLAALRALINE